MSEPMPDPRDPLGGEPSTASLIERAMRAFERGKYVPPVGPAEAPPPVLTVVPSLPLANREVPIEVPPPGQVWHWQAPRPAAVTPDAAPAALSDVAPAALSDVAPAALSDVAPAALSDAAPAPVPTPPVQVVPRPATPVAAVAAPRSPVAAGPLAAHRPVHRIDRPSLAAHGIVPPESGASAQLEEFRLIKRRLIEQAEDLFRRGGGAAARRIMITSPNPGEGKTYAAINLALSLAAEKDSDVLLVDLDLARGSIGKVLGLPANPGLMEAIVDPALDVRDMVLRTDVPGLSVLPGGRPTRSDAEYLASARAQAVLDVLSAQAPARIVLFDTPPVLAASLPVELAKLVGQGVMVVRANATSASAINDAASLLAGCPNLQLLLNAVQFSPSGRRFGAYHGYRG